ncbi:hypothetical protein ACHAWF_006363, partial [Thalassiosira exigua]
WQAPFPSWRTRKPLSKLQLSSVANARILIRILVPVCYCPRSLLALIVMSTSDGIDQCAASRKRAAELHEALFVQPKMEDCPICCLPISCGVTEATYKTCCGKTICDGCIVAMTNEMATEIGCSFCRASIHCSNKEWFKRIDTRIKHNDGDAHIMLGWAHHNGFQGLVPNKKKAFEHWLKGSELGATEGHNVVAMAYFEGRGVQKNEERAFRYMELAALGGDAISRHNLAAYELRERNSLERSLKHFMIAAASGLDNSLDTIKNLVMTGRVSKDGYETALRAHKDAIDAITSDQRKSAVASSQFASERPPIRYV